MFIVAATHLVGSKYVIQNREAFSASDLLIAIGLMFVLVCILFIALYVTTKGRNLN